MQADYLILSNGRKVRILWNMNALAEFTRITGSELTELSGKVDIATLRTIAWCAAKEGEEAEGRSLELDEFQFGRLIDMSAIMAFSEILVSQSSGAGQKKNRPPQKFPLVFFRKKE